MDQDYEHDPDRQIKDFYRVMSEMARYHQLALMMAAMEQLEQAEELERPKAMRPRTGRQSGMRTILRACVGPFEFLAFRLVPLVFQTLKRRRKRNAYLPTHGRDSFIDSQPFIRKHGAGPWRGQMYRLLPETTGRSKDRRDNERPDDPPTN